MRHRMQREELRNFAAMSASGSSLGKSLVNLCTKKNPKEIPSVAIGVELRCCSGVKNVAVDIKGTRADPVQRGTSLEGIQTFCEERWCQVELTKSFRQ